MDVEQIAIGGGGVGVIVAILAWIRYRKKDVADVSRAQAEANVVIINNFQNLIANYRDENQMLKATVNELKTQVFKLTEQVNKLQSGR